MSKPRLRIRRIPQRLSGRHGFALILVIGILAVLMIVAMGLSTGAIVTRQNVGRAEARSRLLCEERAALISAFRQWNAATTDTKTLTLAFQSLTTPKGAEAKDSAGYAAAAQGVSSVTIARTTPEDPIYPKSGLPYESQDVSMMVMSRLEAAGGVMAAREATYLIRGGDWKRQVSIEERFLR